MMYLASVVVGLTCLMKVRIAIAFRARVAYRRCRNTSVMNVCAAHKNKSYLYVEFVDRVLEVRPLSFPNDDYHYQQDVP